MLDKFTAGTKPAGEVSALASKGRNGDTEIAHMTVGEIVVPLPLQTPQVMSILHKTFAGAGVPLSQYTVAPTGKGKGKPPVTAPENPASNNSPQDAPNRINPETGMPEYGFFSSIGGILKKVAGVALPIVGSIVGGPIGGAIGGAVGAKISGGNPLIGGLTGGIGGLASGPFSAGFNASSSLPWLSQVSAGTLAPNAFVNPLTYAGAGFADTALGGALKNVSPFLSKASKALSLVGGGGASNGGVNITSPSMPGTSQHSAASANRSSISNVTAGTPGGSSSSYDGSIPVDMIGTGTDQYGAGNMVSKNQAASGARGVSSNFGGGVDITSLPWQQPAVSDPNAPGAAAQGGIMDAVAGKDPSTYWQDAFKAGATPAPVANPQTGMPQFAAPVPTQRYDISRLRAGKTGFHSMLDVMPNYAKNKSSNFTPSKINPVTNAQEFNVASEFSATLVPTGQTLARNGVASKGADTSEAISDYDTLNTYLGKALTDTGIKLPNQVYFRGGYNQNYGGPYFYEINGEYIPVNAYDDASMYNALTKIVKAGGGDDAATQKLSDWYNKTGTFAPAAAAPATPLPPPTPIQHNPLIPSTTTPATASSVAHAAAQDAGMMQGAANQGFNVAQLTSGPPAPTAPGTYTPQLDQNTLMQASRARAYQRTKDTLGADGTTGDITARPQILSALTADQHHNPATAAQEFFFKDKKPDRGRDMPVYGMQMNNIMAGKKPMKGMPATARRVQHV